MTGWLPRNLLDWAANLRFPWLLLVTAVVFAINLVIPDVLPFVDEILLGLATVILAKLKVRRTDKPPMQPRVGSGHEKRR